MYNVALLLCFELSFICAKKSEGGPIARVSEVKASFRNFSPMRPIIMRLADTMLKVEKISCCVVLIWLCVFISQFSSSWIVVFVIACRNDFIWSHVYNKTVFYS